MAKKKKHLQAPSRRSTFNFIMIYTEGILTLTSVTKYICLWHIEWFEIWSEHTVSKRLPRSRPAIRSWKHRDQTPGNDRNGKNKKGCISV